MTQNKEKTIQFGVLLIVLLVYLPTFGAYFQQDEWIAFGNALSGGEFSILKLLSFSFSPNVGHYVPFHHILFGILFQLFGIDYVKWMLISILWHLGTTYIVGRLLYKLLRNYMSATVGMLLFGLSGAAHQATTWVVADINTHGSTFFGILSILAFLHVLEMPKVDKRWLTTSLGLVFISLLFKETTIGLFATLPALYLLKKTSIRTLIHNSRVWVISGFIYVVVRGLMFLLPSAQGTASVVTASQSIGMIFYNMITFPSKALSQSLIPSEIWLSLGKKIGKIPAKLFGIEVNTSRYELFVQSQLLEAVFVLLFISALILSIYLYRKFSNYHARLALFSLFFVSANSVVYAFSPERTGVISFIDSRNLYLTLVGAILFILSIIQLVSKNAALKFVYICVSLLLLINTVVLVGVIRASVTVGSVRKTILSRIDTIIPSGDKALIYLESDTSYYGLPWNKTTVPFQSGFGQTLLVYLHDRYRFPPEFYTNYFLWPIYSEGYITKGNSAYGFFNQFDSVVHEVKNGASLDNVYSLKWHGKTEALVDTTEVTRQRISETLK